LNNYCGYQEGENSAVVCFMTHYVLQPKVVKTVRPVRAAWVWFKLRTISWFYL